MINFIFTFLTIPALIAILLLVLNKIYFTPIGNIIRERDEKIENETRQIKSLSQDIDQKTGQLESKLKETQLQARKIKEEAIKKGEQVRTDLISEARKHSQEIFAEQMKKLEEELKYAEKQLEQEIRSFSQKIKETLLA